MFANASFAGFTTREDPLSRREITGIPYLRMRHRLAIWLASTLAALLSPAASAQTVPDLLKKIDSGWEFLQQLDEQQCQYTLRHSQTTAKEGELGREDVERISRKPGFIRNTTAKKDITGIEGFNPDYFFTIGQREGKGAYVTRVTRTDPSTVIPDIRYAFLFGAGVVKYYPLSNFNHQPGLEALRSPSFTITDSRPAQGGLINVSVRFDFTQPRPNSRSLPIALTMTLDPNRHYCVLGFRYDAIMGAMKDFEFSRTVDEIGGRLVCTRCELKQPATKEHHLFEFTDYDFVTTLPDREYYLSHYGLPEPVGVTAPAKTTRLYVWLSIAAVAAFALAIAFRYLAKRHVAKPAAGAAGSK